MAGRAVWLPWLLAALSVGLVAAQRSTGGEGGWAAPHLAQAGPAPTAGITSLWQLGSAFTRTVQLARENDSLRLRIAALQAEQARRLAAEQENQRLTGLLALRAQKFPTGLAARVAWRDPTGWFAELVLDRGSANGVRPDMVAASPGGLVGRVTQVTGSGCRVQLLLAAGSAVPVMLARSGAVGILYGSGGYSCKLRFVSHDVQVQEGEEVVTSGLGRVYPPGLLVGRVIHNYGPTEALFQSLDVEPAVDFGRLLEVLIVSAQ